MDERSARPHGATYLLDPAIMGQLFLRISDRRGSGRWSPDDSIPEQVRVLHGNGAEL
jgi:hypothetical protein